MTDEPQPALGWQPSGQSRDDGPHPRPPAQPPPGSLPRNAAPHLAQRRVIDMVAAALCLVVGVALVIWGAVTNDGSAGLVGSGITVLIIGVAFTGDALLATRRLRHPERPPLTGTRNWEDPDAQI